VDDPVRGQLALQAVEREVEAAERRPRVPRDERARRQPTPRVELVTDGEQADEGLDPREERADLLTSRGRAHVGHG
jgi:hypothetical protein